MFCSETKCVYDALGNLDCANCKDKCCKHLEMEVFDIKLLDISCSTCKETYCSKQTFYDGPDTGSIGSRVTTWTVRQCRSRQDWGNPVEDTKTVNANDEQFALAA